MNSTLTQQGDRPTAAVDPLLPTRNRLSGLIYTLSGVAAQSLAALDVIVADQSDVPVGRKPVIETLRRIIEAHGGSVEWHDHAPVWGIAEQRDFLLRQAAADSVLYLDDDVFMEPWVIERLLATLRADLRPAQQMIEFWDGPVRPETIEPDSPAWERQHLHRAANAWHVAQRLRPGESRTYRVAWVASCVLYDRAKLLSVGGFSFWPRLPRYHSGEEVLVQNLLVRRWGGCALLPSGTYHAELPSTVLNGAGTVDGHAPRHTTAMAEEPAG